MPSFALSDASGVLHDSGAIAGEAGPLVIFMCNHCPFVVHVAGALGRLGREWPQRGIGIVGINSNDVVNYPEDAPSLMDAFAARHGITYPYLFDASQQTARDFDATCTPDFFLYNAGARLAYRGQLDTSRPGSEIPVTGDDLRQALEAVSTGQAVSDQQSPSIGCNIKWKSCSTCRGDQQ